MGIKQSMRPKHQVLIMKCYPQYQKSANEVKPNPSELSYLLYYASTRRSKLQKVGEYLETRNLNDVRKSKFGNVQVTLDITAALIDKCPRDLALFVPSVLNILTAILHSQDINFIEESIPTFSTLCAHLDQTTFVADPSLSKQYQEIIETYTTFASRKKTASKSNAVSSTEAVRYRTAGLQAIKSLVASDTFSAGTSYIRIVLPAILEQLVSSDPLYLRMLQKRENASDQHEKQRRRTSFSAAKSSEIQRRATSVEAEPTSIVGTAAELDERAIEDLGMLALQCLRMIFSSDNRGQVRVATTAALDFGLSELTRSRVSRRRSFQETVGDTTWLAELFEMLCRWTPVQDRFIMLVTGVETLISSPIIEDDLPRQYELAHVVTHLLRSDINLIGLSVMDVLIGLIQHVLLLLQLGGRGSSIVPHPQQRLPKLSASGLATVAENANDVVMEVVKLPTSARYQLLAQMQECISDLAVHIYYTDQIGDMISALLLRLKPSATSISSPTAAVQNPEQTVDAIADSANFQEKPQTDSFFSFDTARIIALQCVKAIIVTANSRSENTGIADIRNRVDISVWEGTQWLLRDPDIQVRRAYVDALLTWLDLELSQKGLRLAEDSIQPEVKPHRQLLAQAENGPKRHFSNASTRKRAAARAHTSFMQLLHLAIYEQALSHAQLESEMLLLHLLLATLVRKLGVNSIISGLPMMFRLQEDIKSIDDPASSVHIASLTYGYFWAISETFEFGNSAVGRQIRGEVSRRASQGLWVKAIKMPPTPLSSFDPNESSSSSFIGLTGGHPSESLNTLASRDEFVELIADGYSQNILSPPSSPPISPGRPVRLQSTRSVQTIPATQRTLPGRVRAQMLEPWSREACVEAVELERGRTASLSGSKTGSGSVRQTMLTAEPGPMNGGSKDASGNLRAQNSNGALGARFSSPAAGRFASPGSARTPLSDSSAKSVVRVDELKKALAGSYIPARPASHWGLVQDDQTSESMVSGEFSASETSLPHGLQSSPPTGDGQYETRAPSGVHEADPLRHSIQPVDDDIPPVPMLPANLRNSSSNYKKRVIENDFRAPNGQVVEAREERQEAEMSHGAPHTVDGSGDASLILPGKVDLRSILSGLDVISTRRSTQPVTGAPPY